MMTSLLDFVVTCFNTRGPWTTATPALIRVEGTVQNWRKILKCEKMFLTVAIIWENALNSKI